MGRPNILLVTVDSLRADHVFGEAAATPAMDQLSDEAAVATTGIAQGPFTTFSMPSLITSKYPSQLTSIDFVEGVEGVLVKGADTIQQRLSGEGYRTAGIHSNPLLSETFGFDVGFDHFYDSVGGSFDRFPERLTFLLTNLQRLFRRTAYVPAEAITDRTLTWLADIETDSAPVFLWVHYMDVHGPYQLKSGFTYFEKIRGEMLWRKAVNNPDAVTAEERTALREAYVEEIEYMDREIGRLLDAFRDVSYRETLIALTADHGEEFYEHGSYSHENKLYDELIQVPLLVDLPGRPSLEIAYESQMPLLDVSPTLVEAGGGSISDFEGTPLPHSDEGADSFAGEEIVSEAQLQPSYIGAVRTPNWKYIETPNGEEMYNLATDPGETDNLAADEPTERTDLANYLASHRERTFGEVNEDAVLDSGELDERLRSLGYLE